MDGAEPMSRRDALTYLQEHRNWGRWGPDDQRGAVNLVSERRRRAAAGLVRSGRVVSLARHLDRRPGAGNPHPLGHEVIVPDPYEGSGMGAVEDRLTMRYHGWATTHLDALCHTWSGDEGMWGGRDPSAEVGPSGITWGDVTQWSDQLVGRGVLLDIPALRGVPYVELGRPVEGSELTAAAERQAVELQPGDFLAVYCGRDAWEAADGGRPYRLAPEGRPGVGSSCVPFVREHDVAVLLWDMIDAEPMTVHGVIWAFGVGLVDNCELGVLARTCAALGRYEFLMVVAPLPVPGATGSPVNPLALL